MKLINRTVAAAVAVTALATILAAATYASPQRPWANEMAVLMGHGIPEERAEQALHVQNEIGKVRLVSKVEATLSDAYAGVWFEPDTATLHVGVTSAASANAVRALVTKLELTPDVVATPVRSTWAALLAAQHRWSEVLAGPLSGHDAIIGLDPASNSVSIVLDSRIPASYRALIKHEASDASVNVVISAAASSRLDIEPLAICKAPFVSGEAWCKKTLVSGVGIVPGAGRCTAGPVLVRGIATYMLTAGHCFGAAQNNIQQVNVVVSSAYPNEPAVLKEVGKEGSWYNSASRDMAEVRVRLTSAFSEPLPNPLPALMTEWEKSPEEPHTVTGEEENVVGEANCHEGQTSGEQCGKVEELNVTVIGKEHLVKDSACGEGGDSGGPFFAREDVTQNVLMQGVLVAGNVEKTCAMGGKETFYEPLKDLVGAAGFGILSTYVGQSLLTTATADRRAGRGGARKAEFKSLPSVKTFKGKTGPTELDAGNTIVACEQGLNGGEITSMDTVGKLVITFTGCSVEAESKVCTLKSVGAKNAGEIITRTLKGELGTVKSSEAESEVGLLLEPETTKRIETLAETTCAHETEVSGSLAGEVSPASDKVAVAGVYAEISSGKEAIKQITVLSGEKKPSLEAYGTAADEELADELAFGSEVEIV